MQRSTIIQQHDKWCLRFYENVVRSNGSVVRKKSFRILAPVSQEYPTKTLAQTLADQITGPLNSGILIPESSRPLIGFIDNHYLPAAQ